MTSRGNAHRTISTTLLRKRGFFRPSRGLQARVRRVASLTPVELGTMWTLFHGAYAGATREAFTRDLAEKHHVIVLKDEHRVVQGFSTLLRLQVEGALIVFSGDTIVTPGFWGQTALQRPCCIRISAPIQRDGWWAVRDAQAQRLSVTVGLNVANRVV